MQVKVRSVIVLFRRVSVVCLYLVRPLMLSVWGEVRQEAGGAWDPKTHRLSRASVTPSAEYLPSSELCMLDMLTPVMTATVWPKAPVAAAPFRPRTCRKTWNSSLLVPARMGTLANCFELRSVRVLGR